MSIGGLVYLLFFVPVLLGNLSVDVLWCLCACPSIVLDAAFSPCNTHDASTFTLSHAHVAIGAR